MKLSPKYNRASTKEEKNHNNRFIIKLHRMAKNPFFAVILLMLATICFIVYSFIPDYSYKIKSGGICLKNPENYCTSDSGLSAVVDNRNNLYCMDESGKLIYAVNTNQFPYDNIEIIEAAFGPNNYLYCHIAIYNESAFLTNQEAVLEIDTSGKIGREIVHYDYRETNILPNNQVRINGIHFCDNELCYLYTEENGYSLVCTNLNNSHTNNKIYLPKDGFNEIIKCHGISNGGYLILKNNGEIGSISFEGKYSAIYKAEYNARNSIGIYPYDAFVVNDKLYMLAGHDNPSLYEWDNNDWKLIVPIKDNISESADLYSFGLGEYLHMPAININESIYVLDEGKLISLYNGGLSVPFYISAFSWLKQALPFIALLFFALGIIFGLCNLMGWHLSILSKQLLSTIPIVLIMLIIVTAYMLFNMANLNTEDILHETIAINEIAASMFDGEELSTITGFESVENGEVARLNDKLREFMNSNQSYWSRNYNLAIFVRTTGENYLCVASSDAANRFMSNSFSTDAPINEEFYNDSNTFAASITYGEENENLHLVLATPIYKTDGSYDAIMMLTAEQNRLIQNILATGQSVLIFIVICVSLLVIVITLVSAHNVKPLKEATKAVSQIAGGDFSVRIGKYSNDEAGEICTGVNNMADKLEAYFEEKNRNEQFYYKFVPEKFRELLDKEYFTDLALGDAKSKDLSIMFCDIRAFSLNSEMMTARESFDFVNKIYGIAGPIIREHNGFVDKYIGDAVMALFESADDAVATGIELYRVIAQKTDFSKEFGISSVNIGIGIHSGMARIGIVGEEERMSGTVISSTVNICSRMEALTKQYDTAMLISKDTLDRMTKPDVLTTRYLGMVQVAGVNEVVSLYEVLDCLEEVQYTKRKQTKKEFREAVRLFHIGELRPAMDIFHTLIKTNPEDIASRLYAEYIEDKLTTGDLEHNVFRFKSKQ